MQYFYASSIDENQLVLSNGEAQHARKSLRKNIGDEIRVMDGQGGIYTARIDDIQNTRITASILERTFVHQSIWRPWLVVAPTKKADKMEWMVEKCTELGVRRISFVDSQYTERKKINMARMHKIMVSAAKQSGQANFPSIDDQMPIAQFLGRQDLPPTRCIAHCHGQPKLRLNALSAGESVVFLIGPEGDFSMDEIASAKSAGFREISLGSARLRTETAAMHVSSAIHFLNQADS